MARKHWIPEATLSNYKQLGGQFQREGWFGRQAFDVCGSQEQQAEATADGHIRIIPQPSNDLFSMNDGTCLEA